MKKTTKKPSKKAPRKQPVKIDEIDKKTIVKLLLKGSLVKDVAKEFNVAPRTIHRIAADAARNEKKKPSMKNSYTKEFIEKWKHPNQHGAISIIKGAPEEKIDLINNIVRKPMFDPVNRPAHYADSKIEVIDVIEDKKLNYHLGNAVKCILRAGKKTPDPLQDLLKAQWYLNREISNLKNKI